MAKMAEIAYNTRQRKIEEQRYARRTPKPKRKRK
jgi:hypothetical protein